MIFVELECAWCHRHFQASTAEIKRQQKRGRVIFFCGRSCSGSHSNHIRGNVSVEIMRRCPQCCKEFRSSSHSKAATFCSRSCASAGSVTTYRRTKAQEVGHINQEKLTIEGIAKGLRVREGWRYRNLEQYLQERSEPYQFEFPLDKYVYDLALPNRGVLVEFDEVYHCSDQQRKTDIQKRSICEISRLGCC